MYHVVQIVVAAAVCYLVVMLRDALRRRDARSVAAVVGSALAGALLSYVILTEYGALRHAVADRAMVNLHNSLHAGDYRRAYEASNSFMLSMSRGSSFLEAMMAMDQALRAAGDPSPQEAEQERQ